MIKYGKEGHRPYQIIRSHLEVGGHLMPNASNGNTNVFINNRQITKSELMMLQAAGEQCEGNPNFWLTADGFYQEEGQSYKGANMGQEKSEASLCSLVFAISC